MKTFSILLSALLLCFVSYAQSPLFTFSISTDTSYMLFEDMPRLTISKIGSGKNTNFQMPRKDFKSFLQITSYLQSSRAVLLSNETAYKDLVIKKDSAIAILKLKYDAEVQRAENFKATYEDLKLSNKASHDQLNRCIDDMKKLTNEKKKSERWAFAKGVLWGIVIGSVGGIIAGAAL